MKDEIFGFLFADPYEERKVENTKIEDYAVVDTCAVNDRSWNYETGICHKDFYNNQWIIVEGYVTKEQAIKGHSKWVKKMKKNDFDFLTDTYEEETYEREN